MRPDPASRDITNRAFRRRLEGILREAHEMLDEILEERGVELPPADAEDRILPLLVTLGRLRRDVEATFPAARTLTPVAAL